MKILAIESSGAPASAAVAQDGLLLAEFTLRYKKTHSQTLLPMMEQIRKMLELDVRELDAVAVAGGPGSFTGLRIGSATAKGIGLAADLPLVHVPTLEAMAYNCYGSDRIIVPMLDARRSQVFAGIYTFAEDGGRIDVASAESCAHNSVERGEGDLSEEGDECSLSEECGEAVCFRDPLRVIMDQTPVDVKELCRKVSRICSEQGKEAVLLGDGAISYRELIGENLTAPHHFAPAHLNEQRAGSVAVRAMDMVKMGKTENAAAHRPDYLRVSQAERVRAEKARGSEQEGPQV